MLFVIKMFQKNICNILRYLYSWFISKKILRLVLVNEFFHVKHLCHFLSENIIIFFYIWQKLPKQKVYFDPSGYGSIRNTLSDAKQIDSTIKLDDVTELFAQYVEQKKQLHGTNSFVANGAKYEYQIDLFHYTSWKPRIRSNNDMYWCV